MLQSLEANVAVCLERAYHAREQAGEAADEDSRAFWLAMAQKWQDLAQSYELQRRVDKFVRVRAKSGAR
jgi:hypothetical protein